MGFISGLLGGQTGAGFQAQGANVLNPTTTDQAQTAYGQQQQALQQQQAFVNALQAQGQQGMGIQSALGQQLSAQAAGAGPNPAQAALNQNTAANTANQAALMAGQRGASQNTGLIAREVAQQGAANQQNAIGQGATLQAQQQLAAQQQLQQLAQSQIGQQGGATQQLNQNALQGQQDILGGINQQNQANVTMQSNQNSANAGIAGINAGNQAKAIGGLFGASSLGTVMGAAPPPPPGGAAALAASRGGEITSKGLNGPSSHVARYFSKGGEVKALLSPGEKVLSRQEAEKVAKGGEIKDKGREVPGKAKVAGDSLKNDNVKANLKEGDVVVPRTKNDDGESARRFVSAVMTHSTSKRKRK